MFSLNCEKYNPVRRYVQFNDIVIDSFDMLSSVDYSQNTKTDTEEYSFGHGSYVDFKSPQQFLTEGDLNITMNIDYRKYRREERKYLKDFIKMNLIKPGRLWAIEDNKILWTYARMGEAAIEALLDGQRNVMIGTMNGKIVYVPVSYTHLGFRTRRTKMRRTTAPSTTRRATDTIRAESEKSPE